MPKHTVSGSLSFGYRGWSVVLGTVLGLMVGSGAIKIFAFSVLLKPTAEGTGLTREAIGLAFLIGNTVAMLFTPIYGRLLDARGLRTVTVPLVVLWGITMASFALLGHTTSYLIYPLYIASGLFSVAATPIPYSKAITSWFADNRGLALGIGVSGVGLGGFIMPPFVQALEEHFGWRAAYVGIGVVIVAVAVPSLLALVRMKPGGEAAERRELTPRRYGPAENAIRTMLRSRQFWCLGVMFFLFTAVQGIVAHLAAMLTDRGVNASTAATALSLTGIAVVAGRLLCGWLLDRIHAPWVAAIFLIIPAAGCAALATSGGVAAAMIAACGLGLSIGAEVDVLGYLTSRYFEIRSYGTVYGFLFSLVTFGTSSSPYIVSLVAKANGYGVALLCACVALLISAGLSVLLGPYPPATEDRSLRGADDLRPQPAERTT